MAKSNTKDFLRAALLGLGVIVIAPPLTGAVAGFIPVEFLTAGWHNISVLSAVVGGAVVMASEIGLGKLKYFK